MSIIIGSSTSSTAAQNLIMSVRDRIPDPVDNPADDGGFKVASLIRWINEGMRYMCGRAPLIIDWYAFQSEAGMDVYELPGYIMDVQQLWYDLWPCWRSPELDAIWTTKVTQRSYFFGPHSQHAIPRIHVWPAADRTGQSKTLNSAISATDKTITLNTVTSLQPYGFVKIQDELVLYRTINASPTNTLTQVLRGQGGTDAVAHNDTSVVTECNIMFKGSRLAKAIVAPTDIIELPEPLWPVLELYVLACVRDAENEAQEARSLRKEFTDAVDQMAAKGQIKYPRQGLQVREYPPGPTVYFGRTLVP